MDPEPCHCTPLTARPEGRPRPAMASAAPHRGLSLARCKAHRLPRHQTPRARPPTTAKVGIWFVHCDPDTWIGTCTPGGSSIREPRTEEVKVKGWEARWGREGPGAEGLNRYVHSDHKDRPGRAGNWCRPPGSGPGVSSSTHLRQQKRGRGGTLH